MTTTKKQKLRRRHTKKRQELIDDHSSMVDTLLAQFLRKEPQFAHLGEDMRQEAFARLVDSIDRFINGGVANLKGLLASKYSKWIVGSSQDG